MGWQGQGQVLTALTVLILATTAQSMARADVPATKPAAAPAPATPEQIAVARKEGDDMLIAARAQDVFDNETGRYGTAAILLRHKASGFICIFEPGRRQNYVTVYPNPHRGDDVGCNTMTPIGDRTTNFTRDQHTDQQMLDGAAAALRRRLADAQPAPTPAIVKPYAKMFPNVPTPKSARFVTDKSLEEVISAHVDGWLVEDRFSAPVGLAQSNTIDAHWYLTVSERLKHQSSLAQAVSAPQPAQTAVAGAPGNASDEELAVARREGDRILSIDGTQALFDNVTNSKEIELRHKASGLTCRFELGGANTLVKGAAAATTTRADAVNCLSSAGAASIAITVMTNRDHLSAAQALDAEVGATKGIFHDLTPAQGDAVRLNEPNLPPHVSVRLTSSAQTGGTSVYLAAAVVGDWIVTERVMGPRQPAMLGDLTDELKMIETIKDLAKANQSAPVAASP